MVVNHVSENFKNQHLIFGSIQKYRKSVFDSGGDDGELRVAYDGIRPRLLLNRLTYVNSMKIGPIVFVITAARKFDIHL